MLPIQSLLLVYTGMLIESKPRREQFMKFLNSAGIEVEKAFNGLSNKGGEPKNEPPEPESTEYK